LKKIVLELGGSDPFIVLADADIDFAARNAVQGRLLCTGQSCIAAKRFIVERAVADAFTERFAELMSAVTVGDPLDPETEIGAIVNEEELAALLAQLADSVALGARVLTGGHRLERPGAFLAPTVVTDVTATMRIAAEEVFGPIAPVIVVADAEEALRVANASPFGLGGSVWTRDLARGEEIARRLDSGTVFVNSITKSDPRMPFGGIKKSGFGRELAQFGLREFTNIKGLNVYEHG
jgi:succinate-semialdehyde dehydrogenase/glutarate-semialdehyde dehydrogenase